MTRFSQDLLPPVIARWFAARGWSPRRHQMEMLEANRDGVHALLIAPTGAGKTLAGFLPTLASLARGERQGLHTVYVSPLKALSVDVSRNLMAPIAEMGLDIRVETRTGDTASHKKARQRVAPPDILLTTPESLSLLLSYPEAGSMFEYLRTIIIDEIHAFAPTKRGDLLSLALARLQRLAPHLRRFGLSATVADEAGHARWLAPGADEASVRLVRGEPGAVPDIDILVPQSRIPWGGHTARHAVPAIYDLIQRHRLSLVFTNTRANAERLFQDLWSANSESLPIALHHGSLAAEQRRRVEAAMAAGALRAVVATASLDLGIDWGDIDLVIQVGAPKGASRLLQRIGRANHRLDEPSRAVLLPTNRFEYLESVAARDAALAGDLDGESFRPGGLDVLAQHVMGLACAAPFEPDALFAEVRAAAPYEHLSRADFDDTLAFIENGGYSLRAYDRFRRLVRMPDGRYRVSHPRLVLQHRLNAGVILDAPMLEVKVGRRSLGRVEESFAEQLTPGDTFLFAGRVLEFERLEKTTLYARPSFKTEPMVPAYLGGRLPLSASLADRVRRFLAEPASWRRFPEEVQEWLEAQAEVSALPEADGLLIETFPRRRKQYMVAYCFEGRAAHQSLGLLLTRRMERLGLAPLGFVANDYGLAVWSLYRVKNPVPLFLPDILHDELTEWLAKSALLKRSFRDVAVISGLVERQHPGLRKTGRQLTISSDLIYDVLRQHEPGHLLLRATWADARGRLTDIDRLSAFLERMQGHILHQPLSRVSPLAVPILLEIGQERIEGSAEEVLLAEAERLMREATR